MRILLGIVGILLAALSSAHALTAVKYHDSTGCYTPVGAPSYATLNAAITELTWDACLLIPRTKASGTSPAWAITQNLTIPARIQLKVEQGAAVLTPSAAITLTVDRCPLAEAYPIFDADETTTGAIRFVTGACLDVPAAWFGFSTTATPSVNRLALQASHNASSYHRVVLPSGTFTVNTHATTGKVVELFNPGVQFLGAGMYNTTLVMEAGQPEYVGWFIGRDDATAVLGFTLKGMKLDPNFANNIVDQLSDVQGDINGFTPRRAGVHTKGPVYDLLVDEVWCRNFARQCVMIEGAPGTAARITVRNSLFTSDVNNPGIEEWDVTHVLINAEESTVEGNAFYGFSPAYFLARTGVQAVGSNMIVRDNKFDKIYRAIVAGCSNWAETCAGVTVTGNVIDNANTGIWLLPIAFAPMVSGAGLTNSIVAHNVIRTNSVGYHLLATDEDTPAGIQIDVVHTLHTENILIDGNLIDMVPWTLGGNGGIDIEIGASTPHLNLKITNNTIRNPSFNCIFLFGPTMNTEMAHNTCIDPANRTLVSDQQGAAVRIGGLHHNLTIRNMRLADTRTPHLATAVVNLTNVEVGSTAISVIDPELYFVDGSYTEPLVQVENGNAVPFVRGRVQTFVPFGDLVAAGSNVQELSTGFLYYNRGAGDGGWCANELPGAAVTAPLGDTTPSVKGLKRILLANVAPTAITNFDDGCVGQELTVICFGDASSTMADAGFLHLNTVLGAFACTDEDTITLIRHGTGWFEVGRSVN